MEFDRKQIRTILLYEYLAGHNATEATQNINAALGSDVVSYDTAKVWHRKFKNGEYCLEDEPHHGRPVELDVERLKVLVEMDPRRTTTDLGEELMCSHTTIGHHLHQLGKRWKYGAWIPHQLEPHVLQARLDACMHLLSFKRNYQWLRNLVTGDEKWVFYVNHTRKRQWLGTKEHGIPTPNPDLHPKKVMLSIWWNVNGPIHWELLPTGTTVTAALYCEQLDRLAKKLNGIQDKVYFLHDNARPHVAKICREKLQQLGWTVLIHPPYSPDLAPSDYHLFLSLSGFLSDKKFDDEDHVKSELTKFFKSKTQEFYTNGIMSLPSKWQHVIDNNGEYI